MARKKQDLCTDQVALEAFENGKIYKKPKITRKALESFKSTLSKILSLKIAPETVPEAVLKTPLGDKITYQEAILIAQVLKAACGDNQAASYLRDTSGNKIKEKETEVTQVKKFEDF